MTPTPAPPALGVLLDCHRAGRLASDYPAVRGMITGLSDEDLVTAGQLLSRIDPAEVLREHPGTPVLTVAITGYGTLSPLAGSITAELARHGLLARTWVSSAGSYLFDLGDAESSLYATAPDLVLCVLDPMMIFDEVPLPWRPEDVERIFSGKLAIISGLAARFEAASSATLVLNTLPLLQRHTAQLVDHSSRTRLSAVWHEGNTRLLRLTAEHAAVITLDLAPLLAEGIPAEDPRLSQYARAHLAPQLLARYAREVGHLARSRTGQTKKVLVLDLDGTLWGGVLGETSSDEVEAAGTYRGEAFRAFQRVIKQLGTQGVLLAAVSKNDIEPVRAVFRNHPDMVLREEDFVRIIANWHPKHDNLIQLAKDLNVGLDSLVFVDDSAYECGLIRHELPGVAVIQLSAEPARHTTWLLRDSWFGTREITEEDHVRLARYRHELARKDFLDNFDSLDEYLSGLQIKVTVTRVQNDDAALPRISQLTLRTNQFNLTGRRLQPAELRQLLADPAASVVAIRAADRFGDNGLVGAVFMRRVGSDTTIENFLLSCRVFSRGIEQAGLAAILSAARAAGATSVFGSYRATAKNEKVRDFYLRNGFTQVAADGTSATFCHDLADIPGIPTHIHLTNRLGENSP
jgi:FkbH-like protein